MGKGNISNYEAGVSKGLNFHARKTMLWKNRIEKDKISWQKRLVI